MRVCYKIHRLALVHIKVSHIDVSHLSVGMLEKNLIVCKRGKAEYEYVVININLQY